MNEQLALLPEYGLAHLQLALAALAVGTLVSVPLGVAVHRRPRLEAPLLGAASVVQTVPSLALLAVMVPIFALFGAGIGALPALVALSLYSLLPILRNTVTGLAGVDPAVREAARGVGMTPRQELWRVELPLALPVIVAGVRTSAVWVVGTATLSTPIGATSLGNYIFGGLATRNDAAVLTGCVAAAGLALGLDQLIRALEAGVRTRRRAMWGAAALVLAALYLVAGASFAHALRGGGARSVAIGAKAFTEQYVLAELLGRQLAREAGATPRIVPSLGSTVAFDALAQGDIDVYVDYSGTIWATIMKREAPPASREAALDAVRRFLADEHGIALVAALGFENTYALAMRAGRAAELGVASIGDLARAAPRLEIGADYEFFSRTEWKALERRYGLAFARRRSMDPSLMYAAVAAGEVDVISAFSTDGRIAAYDLVLLEDERGVIPPYDAIVLASARLARERPEAVAALAALDGAIDAAAMRAMNHAVDAQGRSPAEVAEGFLEDLRRR